MINHNNSYSARSTPNCPCHRNSHSHHPTPSALASSSTLKADRIIPRSELVERIIAGQNLVIYHRHVLDLTRWADQHPGGSLAVLHFVGRDASDEMDAYHSKNDLKRVKGFVVGKIENKPWRPITPPIALGLVHDPESATSWRREGSTQLYAHIPDLAESTSYYPSLTPLSLEPVQVDSIHCPEVPSGNPVDPKQEMRRSLAYRELRERLERAGLFRAEGWHKGYLGDLVRYTLLAGLAAGFYFRSTGPWGFFCSAVFLGAFWHQLTFLAHDAGHTGITGKAGKDRLIGTIVANWVGGLSLSWWKDNHNIHHLVTNHPEHDPDIQHIPFFAISTEFFGNLWSTYYKRVMPFDGFSNMMVKVQHKVYYIVLAFARFNLYANSYGYLALKMPRNKWFAFELAGLVFFWSWFGMLLKSLEGWKLRVGYLLVSHIVTSPVHVQIVLSHFARSTADLGPSESFVSRQLRTTMDVVCNEWIEFFHGGLHLQVTHHLFPRIPRHNLRRASKLVKEYCREQEIEYAEYSFTEGNKRVLGVLRDVADQVSLLTKVAEADARGELH